ncbi:MAG TPA: stage II sporulation protein R [Syntrophomonas sp.]|jgi:stage II sporulation protein R|nr:stage II sporulation protein R [Syntrophomonas sp.]
MKKISFLLLGIILLIMFAYVWEDIRGTSLSQDVLRLHVIANSDNPSDQQLKLMVKDQVVAQMREVLVDAPNADQARQIAIREIPAIKRSAEETIAAHGYDYTVDVEVGQYAFPTKSYGNLVFPAGDYQAVRVIIGEGQGKNWWCVLFPPLCMVSSSDQGLSLDSPQQAEITLKCLKFLPKGLQITFMGKQHEG